MLLLLGMSRAVSLSLYLLTPIFAHCNNNISITPNGDIELTMHSRLTTFLYSMYNDLNPRWAKIFIVEHDEDRAWTPLKITIYDSRAAAATASSKSSSSSSSGSDKENDSRLIVGSIAMTTTERNNILGVSSLRKSSDPTMGEVNVEVGEILGTEGQELKLDLEQGGL